MERIKFTYTFADEKDGHLKEIHCTKENENGIIDADICEMFLDFMNSVGFSEDNVFRFFKE